MRNAGGLLLLVGYHTLRLVAEQRRIPSYCPFPLRVEPLSSPAGGGALGGQSGLWQQSVTVLTEVKQVVLNKCFFIYYIPLEQEILNG